MGFYQFQKTQKIPSTIEEVWNFISNPSNLKVITPEWLGFKITSSLSNERIYKGMIISYTVKPLPGMKTLWVTEITELSKERYFIDEQRIGPYSLWHHEHWIKPIKGGVLMSDKISYVPPLGILGNLINSLVIRKKLEDIFDFRQETLERIFGKWKQN